MGVIGAIVVVALYILILRFTVKIIVWLSIVGSIVGVGMLAAYLLYMYVKLKENNQLRYDFFGYYDESITKKQKLYEAFGIILAIIACIGIILMLIFCKTIKIAIAVISCSVKCIAKIASVFFFPVIILVFIIAHLIWTCLGAYLVNISGNYDATTNSFDFVDISRDDKYYITRKWNYVTSTEFVFFVFAAIWGVFLCYCLLEYLISAMVVQWYFTRDRTRGGLSGTFRRAVKMTVKAFGTICVTSFITSLIVIIRFIFEFILKRAENSNKIGKSRTVKVAAWFTRCCLKCIQKLVQWFNRNIQIYSCISGEGYCKSTKGAVKLLMAKILSNLFAKGLSSFFLFLGKLVVSFAGTAITAGMILG